MGAKRHPAIGHFVQADTIVPDPTDAKQYDRYAYVSNNPLKYIDPSGHCQTLQDGSRDTADGECWALADQLYDKYDTNMCPVGCLGSISWGRNKWNIDRDVWMAAYAGAWSNDAAQMESWLAEFDTMFYNSRGLTPPTITGGEWKHPIELTPAYDPTNINTADLTIAVLKSGELIGPLVSKIPHPATKVGGVVITVVGEVTSLVVDLAPAMVELSHGNIDPIIKYGQDEVIDRLTGIPGVSTIIDMIGVLGQGFCSTSGCVD